MNGIGSPMEPVGDYNAKQVAVSAMRSLTVGENIDQRIADLEDQVVRLKRVREQLQSPTGLLGVSIQDLRYAMNY